MLCYIRGARSATAARLLCERYAKGVSARLQACLRIAIAVVVASLLLPAPLSAQLETFESLVSDAQQQGEVRVLVSGGWEVITGDFGPVDPETVVTGASEAQTRQSAFLSELSKAGVDTASAYDFRYLPVSVLTLGANDLRTVKRVRPSALILRDEELNLQLEESAGLVGAPRAWAAGYDGSGWMVAVLDSGVDTSHPFLAGKVVREACFSRSCPNGEPSMIGPGAARPLGDHGTHVAGIVVGQSDTMSGVAPGARVIGIQVFSELSSGPSSSLGHVLAALEHVLRLRLEEKLPIAAVNMSLGGGAHAEPCRNRLLMDVAELLLKADVLPVVASGNDSLSDKMSMPACVPGMFSVGAIDKDGTVAPFSNSTSFLDILAPGVDIRSSIVGGGYVAYPGTSMAAPHVAGAAAVIRQRLPNANATEVADLLREGTPITDARSGTRTPALQLLNAMPGVGAGGTPNRPSSPPTVSGETSDGAPVRNKRPRPEPAGVDDGESGGWGAISG